MHRVAPRTPVRSGVPPAEFPAACKKWGNADLLRGAGLCRRKWGQMAQCRMDHATRGRRLLIWNRTLNHFWQQCPGREQEERIMANAKSAAGKTAKPKAPAAKPKSPVKKSASKERNRRA